MTKKLKITQIRSAIGFEQSHGATVRALGIKKLHNPVVHEDTPQMRGMIAKVRHLVRVEETEER
ncbi:MAG: 50S ribosomal protein L30 [Candidatus Eisenbacteria bacterium]